MKRKIEYKLKKIEESEYIAFIKCFITIGFGILLKFMSSIIGFLIGTYFYIKDDYLYLKIDKFFSNLGSILLFATILLSLVFVVRLYKYKNQKKILKSIQ